MDVQLATQADIPALHRLIESAYRGESARRGWTHEADLLDGHRTNAQELNAMIEDPAQRIGRPRQVYTGAPQRDFVALDQRA